MCYTVPTTAAIVSSVIWSRTKDVKQWWLTLLFSGGALFGVIDHWWNGELFLISENIVSDLMLGVVITLVILVSWTIMVRQTKGNTILARYTKVSV